jgi:hypothetical protein
METSKYTRKHIPAAAFPLKGQQILVYLFNVFVGLNQKFLDKIVHPGISQGAVSSADSSLSSG